MKTTGPIAIRWVLTWACLGLVLMTSAQGPPQKKVWRVHVGSDWGGYSYINPEGYVSGYINNIVEAVCLEAGIDCRLVWDKYPNCLYSANPSEHLQGGPGLMGGWYDVCAGWVQTVTRMQIIEYSEPFTKLTATGDSFFVLKGNPNGFDNKNIKGKTIGILDGWSTDESCLNRNADKFGGKAGKTIHYPYTNNLVDAIVAREVDAGWAPLSGMTPYVTNGTVQMMDLPDKIVRCDIAGASVIAPKGSEFTNLWNQGFSVLRSGPKLKKICEEAKDSHGHKGLVECVDS